MPNIDNSEDIMDSRDVESLIDDMTATRDGFREAVEEAQDAYNTFTADRDKDEDGETPSEREEGEELADALAMARKELAEWEAGDEPAELTALVAFRDELADYCDDWTHGVTLVRDSYWKEYAMQYAEDIGAVNEDASWPNDCIDWNKAARELQMDYTSGEFDGVTYWAR